MYQIRSMNGETSYVERKTIKYTIERFCDATTVSVIHGAPFTVWYKEGVEEYYMFTVQKNGDIIDINFTSNIIGVRGYDVAA